MACLFALIEDPHLLLEDDLASQDEEAVAGSVAGDASRCVLVVAGKVARRNEGIAGSAIHLVQDVIAGQGKLCGHSLRHRKLLRDRHVQIAEGLTSDRAPA